MLLRPWFPTSQLNVVGSCLDRVSGCVFSISSDVVLGRSDVLLGSSDKRAASFWAESAKKLIRGEHFQPP